MTTTPSRTGSSGASPSQTAPSEAVPSRPGSSETAPSEAAPSQTAPSEAGSSQTAPSEAGSSEAGSSQPAPSEAGSSQAGSSQPAPSEAAPSEAGSSGAAPSGAGHALLVLAHPRTDSLTARLARHARARLTDAGFTVDLLDLHAEGFDPRMPLEDEPDWADPGKTYSAETRAHMRRVEAADTIVVVFPLWWFGLPAVLKGWIDRVWNHGFAYGSPVPRLRAKRMLWLSLVSYRQDQFADLGWHETVTRTLRTGISAFCGIENASVHYVYDSLNTGEKALASADEALETLLAS